MEQLKHRESYRFYGFDNSMDNSSYCSGENLKSSGDVKLNGKHLFSEQKNGLKKSTSSVQTDTVSKSEPNLKSV